MDEHMEDVNMEDVNAEESRKQEEDKKRKETEPVKKPAQKRKHDKVMHGVQKKRKGEREEDDQDQPNEEASHEVSTVSKKSNKSAKPAYVINLGVLAESDDESDKDKVLSDDEGSQKFSKEDFANPPYRIDVTKRGKFSKDEFEPDEKAKGSPPQPSNAQRLVSVFEREGFSGKDKQSSAEAAQRMGMVILHNRMLSMDKSKNASLQKALNKPVSASGGMAVAQFGHFWEPSWVKEQRVKKQSAEKTEKDNKKKGPEAPERDSKKAKSPAKKAKKDDSAPKKDTKKEKGAEKAEESQEVEVVSASVKEVRQFYKQFIKHDPEAAAEFRQNQEKGLKDADRRAIIPYREVRQVMLDSPHTAQVTRDLRTKNPDADVYLTMVDSSTESLRYDPQKGTFSHYDDALAKHKQEHNDKSAHVLTSGYAVNPVDNSNAAKKAYPDDKARAKNNAMIALSVDLERTVRIATASVLPKGVYFPEPGSAMLIPSGKDKLGVDIVGNDKNYTDPMEMPRVMEQMAKKHGTKPEDVIFHNEGPVVIQPRPRMREKAKGKEGKFKTFTGSVNKSKKVVNWNEEDIKSLKNIAQSHYSARDWAIRLLDAFKPPVADKKKKKDEKTVTIDGEEFKLNGSDQRNMLISAISRIFNAYDPVTIAETVQLPKDSPNKDFQGKLHYVLNNYDALCGKKAVTKSEDNGKSAWKTALSKLQTPKDIVPVIDALLKDGAGDQIVQAAQAMGVAVKDFLAERLDFTSQGLEQPSKKEASKKGSSSSSMSDVDNEKDSSLSSDDSGPDEKQPDGDVVMEAADNGPMSKPAKGKMKTAEDQSDVVMEEADKKPVSKPAKGKMKTAEDQSDVVMEEAGKKPMSKPAKEKMQTVEDQSDVVMEEADKKPVSKPAKGKAELVAARLDIVIKGTAKEKKPAAAAAAAAASRETYSPVGWVAAPANSAWRMDANKYQGQPFVPPPSMSANGGSAKPTGSQPEKVVSPKINAHAAQASAQPAAPKPQTKPSVNENTSNRQPQPPSSTMRRG